MGKHPKKGQKRDFGEKLAHKRREESPQGEGRERGATRERGKPGRMGVVSGAAVGLLERGGGGQERILGGGGGRERACPARPRGKYAGHVGAGQAARRAGFPAAERL